MTTAGGRLRRAVRKVHLWLGLSLGGLFVMLGLTGSLLVFYPELDALMNPEIRVAEIRVAEIRVESQPGSGTSPDWDRALATVRHAYPDKTGPWRFEVTGRGGAIPARYYQPSERAGYAFRPMMVWLSPDGSRVLRRDYWGEYAMTFIYDLHYRLLLGEAGGTILGWTGFALLALLLTGLWAWWPRGSWRKALRFKANAPAQRRLRDWHKLAGLWGLILLAILTVTGIMLDLPEESDAALAGMGLPVQAMPRVVSPPRKGGANVTVKRAMESALSVLPGARIAWIETPGANSGAYRMRMQVANDPSWRFPHSFVWVDGASGAVVAIHDARKAASGNAINNWVHPLHDGSAGGLFGRILVAVSGLVPLILFVTGWWRWRLARRSRSSPAGGGGSLRR